VFKHNPWIAATIHRLRLHDKPHLKLETIIGVFLIFLSAIITRRALKVSEKPETETLYSFLAEADIRFSRFFGHANREIRLR
jgi:hypothetical protein